MASASGESDDEAVRFVHEDDGSVTAVDEETGIARGGETKAVALTQLAEALTLHEGEGDPIEDPDQFSREELDLEPSDDETRDLPEFLQ
jgi:predicted RNase H-like HicB family nuclease